METSIFLAKVLGLTLVVESVAALVKREQLLKLLKDEAQLRWLMFFSGTIAFVLGVTIIIVHNIWTLDFRGLITLIGLIILIKGVLRLFAPEKVIDWARTVLRSQWFMPLMAVTIVLGAYLMYIGFWVGG